MSGGPAAMRRPPFVNGPFRNYFAVGNTLRSATPSRKPSARKVQTASYASSHSANVGMSDIFPPEGQARSRLRLPCLHILILLVANRGYCKVPEDSPNGGVAFLAPI